MELAQNNMKKGKAAKDMKEEMMQVLKNEQACLTKGLKIDLNAIAMSSIELAQEMVSLSLPLPYPVS